MNDHLLYLASTGIVAFTCLLVSGLLLSLKTLRESTIPKYRTACKYLALASALVGIGHIFILSSGTDERTIMELFYFPILLISASQALLFTFLLTLLFRGKNVTRRNILLHAMPTIALTVAYTIACLFREDVHTYRFDVWWDNLGNPPLLIRTLTCLVYLVQLGGYTHFFFRERAIYLGNLKQIPQSPERLELRWVTRAFLWALGIGIAAVSLCFFPNNYYNTAVNFVFASSTPRYRSTTPTTITRTTNYTYGSTSPRKPTPIPIPTGWT
jgi:transcriptional regulator, AraC family